MLKVSDTVGSIRHVGPTLELTLQKKGVVTVGDLLRYFPIRYIDTHSPTQISHLQQVQGAMATIVARIVSGFSRRAKSGKITIQQFVVEDRSGRIPVTFFNQPYLIRQFKQGENYLFYGGVQYYGRGLSFAPREYLMLTDDTKAQGILPVYHSIPGHTQRFIRRLLEQSVLETDEREFDEKLPIPLIQKRSLISPWQAVKALHIPRTLDETENGRKRLAYEELFSYIVPYQKLAQEYQKRPGIALNTSDFGLFLDQIPFTLTDDQQKCIQKLRTDLASASPMRRMLIGEVGSGKTVVAATALFAAARSNKQALLLAPTEVLAQQHANTLKQFFSHLPYSILLLTGSEKKMIHGTGNPSIIVSTHAVLYSKLDLNDCACIIIDEQHKFGVGQRDSLMERAAGNRTAHLLMLSATPIPRTLALTLYGGVSLSWLMSKPVNRKPVKTRVIRSEKREELNRWLEVQLKNKHQIFVVCPAIEENDEELQASVEGLTRRLRNRFAGVNIGSLYSTVQNKDKLLSQFRSGQLQILVSTTVIEVGIDMPDATIIVIEEADHFGLAQLHQLRGRVGRSHKQGYCIAVSSNQSTSEGDTRLAYFEKESNGFRIAEYDLALRGPGSIMGFNQSGFPFTFARELMTLTLLQEIQNDVRDVLANNPNFTYTSPLLAQRDTEVVTHLH